MRLHFKCKHEIGFFLFVPNGTNVFKSGPPTNTTICIVSRGRLQRRNQIKRNLPLDWLIDCTRYLLPVADSGKTASVDPLLFREAKSENVLLIHSSTVGYSLSYLLVESASHFTRFYLDPVFGRGVVVDCRGSWKLQWFLPPRLLPALWC